MNRKCLYLSLGVLCMSFFVPVAVASNDRADLEVAASVGSQSIVMQDAKLYGLVSAVNDVCRQVNDINLWHAFTAAYAPLLEATQGQVVDVKSMAPAVNAFNQSIANHPGLNEQQHRVFMDFAKQALIVSRTTGLVQSRQRKASNLNWRKLLYWACGATALAAIVAGAIFVAKKESSNTPAPGNRGNGSSGDNALGQVGSGSPAPVGVPEGPARVGPSAASGVVPPAKPAAGSRTGTPVPGVKGHSGASSAKPAAAPGRQPAPVGPPAASGVVSPAKPAVPVAPPAAPVAGSEESPGRSSAKPAAPAVGPAAAAGVVRPVGSEQPVRGVADGGVENPAAPALPAVGPAAVVAGVVPPVGLGRPVGDVAGGRVGNPADERSRDEVDLTNLQEAVRHFVEDDCFDTEVYEGLMRLVEKLPDSEDKNLLNALLVSKKDSIPVAPPASSVPAYQQKKSLWGRIAEFDNTPDDANTVFTELAAQIEVLERSGVLVGDELSTYRTALSNKRSASPGASPVPAPAAAPRPAAHPVPGRPAPLGMQRPVAHSGVPAYPGSPAPFAAPAGMPSRPAAVPRPAVAVPAGMSGLPVPPLPPAPSAGMSGPPLPSGPRSAAHPVPVSPAPAPVAAPGTAGHPVPGPLLPPGAGRAAAAPASRTAVAVPAGMSGLPVPPGFPPASSAGVPAGGRPVAAMPPVAAPVVVPRDADSKEARAARREEARARREEDRRKKVSDWIDRDKFYELSVDKLRELNTKMMTDSHNNEWYLNKMLSNHRAAEMVPGRSYDNSNPLINQRMKDQERLQIYLKLIRERINKLEAAG